MIHISVFISFIGQGFISSVEIIRLLISFFSIHWLWFTTRMCFISSIGLWQTDWMKTWIHSLTVGGA